MAESSSSEGTVISLTVTSSESTEKKESVESDESMCLRYA